MDKPGRNYIDFDAYLRQGEPSQREKAMVRYVYKNNEMTSLDQGNALGKRVITHLTPCKGQK